MEAPDHSEAFVIEVEQGLKIQAFQKLQEKNSATNNVSAELERLKSTLMYKERTIDSLQSIARFGETMLGEIGTIYPQINTCSYSESWLYNDSLEDSKKVSVVYFKLDQAIKEEDIEKVKKWLEKRLNTEDIILEMEMPKETDKSIFK